MVTAPAGEEDGKYAGSLRKMTPEALRSICSERHMWNQPHLNSQLFLNYKGFDAIAGLEDYVAVRSLHLGNNNIAKIEGLDRMSDLRSLHLEGNRIRFIENLEGNLELRQLNLENNGIRSVGRLDYLAKLEQLNIAKNNIENLEDLDGLKSLPSLANIDVSHNRVEATEGVVEFWTSLTTPVKVLRYHGNPGIRQVEHYRKRLINGLPALAYLDERPVLPVERRSCAAWAEGGMQAMHKAKRDFHEERHRLENTVDPERREFLTRMRKAALARIEREEREREEEEERRRSEQRPPHAAPDVPPADSGAREGAPASEGPQQPCTAQPSHGQTDDASSRGFTFAPPSRSGSRGRLPSEPQGASSFIVSRSDAKDDVADRLRDRQFSVLGDNPWEGTAGPDPAMKTKIEREFGPQMRDRQASSEKAEAEVMPLIWERLAPAAKEAELKALEQNMSHVREAPCGGSNSVAPTAADPGGNELASLD